MPSKETDRLKHEVIQKMVDDLVGLSNEDKAVFFSKIHQTDLGILGVCLALEVNGRFMTAQSIGEFINAKMEGVTLND